MTIIRGSHAPAPKMSWLRIDFSSYSTFPILVDSLSDAHLLQMLEALEKSIVFAQKFNADMELRVNLLQAGFIATLPNLLRQMTNGMSVYLRILFRVYVDSLDLSSSETTPTRNPQVALSRLFE